MLNWTVQNSGALQMWLGAIGTFAIYSILFKENKVYRLFENIFLGLAAGWSIRIAWIDVLKPTMYDRIVDEGRWWWLFVLPIGMMLYTMYSKKHSWMSRVAVGMLLGLNAGQQFQQFSGQYYNQIKTTFKPIFPQGPTEITKAVTYSGALNNILFLIILVCVTTYFFFSFEQNNKVVKRMAVSGRWMLMVAFGAIFGSTIMARMALCIGRIDFLVHGFAGQLLGGIFPILKKGG